MDFMDILTIILAIATIISSASAIYILIQNSKFRKDDKNEKLCSNHRDKTLELEMKLNSQQTAIELLKSEKANNTDVIKIFTMLENLTNLVSEIRDTIFHKK